MTPAARSSIKVFQSTHPCGVRLPKQTFTGHPSCFNPRTRVGCDITDKMEVHIQRVSIHAPVWGATQLVCKTQLLAVFQSTHPCGVRPNHLVFVDYFACFNPRTRVGCDETLTSNAAAILVSIHAPVWGATNTIHILLNVWIVSIHAPVWGATSNPNRFFIRICFNPRTRVGCDLSLGSHASAGVVSIHAPVWGATIRADKFYIAPPVSIHAPVWGATSEMYGGDEETCFNPRTRVGCDAKNYSLASSFIRFNPRTRVGCDPKLH